MAIYVALVTVFATFLGGSLALRARDQRHLVLGLSGGLLLGLVAFDLIPEVFELNANSAFGNTPDVMVAFIVGFLALHILEHFSGAHEASDHHENHDHDHNHTAGIIGAAAMAVHVFLDGVAVGLAFQVSTQVGWAVAIAVLGHAFTDGLNTVSLLVKSGDWKKSSLALLAVDGVARISGATLGTKISISDQQIGLYLALFAGFLTYLSTSHILPEAHHDHPSRLTLLATISGVVAMGIIINLAAH